VIVIVSGGEDTVIQKLDRQGLMGPRTPLLEHSAGIRALVQHPAPLKWCMDPWELGRPFYNAVKFGIVQYVSRLVSITPFLPKFLPGLF
jgi:hypothetical protein